MSRLFGLPTVPIFLLALAINCIQASQIDYDTILSPVTVLGRSAAGGSQLLITDDDSDDVLHIPTHVAPSSAFNLDAVPVVLHLTYLTPVSLLHVTVLKL